MRADETHMQRLGQGGEHPSSLEARAGVFLGEARSTVGISEIELGAIERRLVRRARARFGRRFLPVFAAAMVLLVAGSVMAVVSGWRPRWFFVGASTEAETPSSRPPKPRATNVGKPGVASIKPTAPEPPPEPAVQARAVTRRTFRQEPLSLVPPLTDRPPSENPISAEAQSLANALARWRRDGNAEAALALLGAHQGRFEHGALAVEAKVARAEILLSLARRAEALGVLDSLSLAGLPRARELHTVRGELRAQAGRCREARADLSPVLRDTPGGELGKRAALALTKCP
jgi:hypothetical protein